MSQKRSGRPLQVNLRITSFHLAYLHLVHALAFCSLLLPVALPFLLKAILVLLIVLYWYRSCLCLPARYRGELIWLDGIEWQWLQPGTEARLLLFRSGRIIWHNLVVFNFVDQHGKNIGWVFTPGSLNEAEFRQLRVYLRYSARAPASGSV